MLKLLGLACETVDAADILVEKRLLLVVQQMHAIVYRCHEDVGRACALKNRQSGGHVAAHVFKTVAVLPQAGAQMQQSGLRGAR